MPEELEEGEEEPQPPQGHIRVVYLGPVAPHWEVQSTYGDAAVIEPFCMTSASANSPENVVEPISSHALPNVAGKRVTVVRVFYGPGGFTPPHYHAGSVTAYVTKGQIRSQLGGGPVETFKVGQSFFEPPGSTHLVSANASTTEPAELIAIFVADEGAQLTTMLKE